MSPEKPLDRNSSEIRIITGDEPVCPPKTKTERKAEDEEMVLTILIEIPKGSQNKYEWDKERKIIKFDRMLFSAVHYPSDYGFILDTLAEDTDPLDALVLVSEPTFPGCLIDAKPIGLFRMRDEKGPDEKILCVPMGDPHWNFIQELSDVPPHLLKEIEHFFRIYKELEKKKTGVEGWEDRDSAIKAVQASRKRYQDKQKQLGGSRI
ncbi:inorganic diphosphatase [Dehalogenimonas etheniformans]|uniref:Inorganic pyrophosphatase n=1 Tax=Dehalogenimonas etheniformans TaxID=1536648 RepID=A0A2P5P638_9CHLR|nr:inorganic diphosphatase [Dehalogenimonas etheniformans]PPD57747.1 inorganic pyrophosphatase [Dehalogenimonas etheniformans]QNT76089.1 inorganic diphosphatase [Dehalogenimonas etheniformans]